MPPDPRQTSLADLRQDLGLAAARTARANRPASWLFAAGALLVLALAFLAWSVSSRLTADAKLAKEKAQAEQMLKDLSQYLALDAQQKQGGGSGSAVRPISDLQTRVARAGTAAGMKAEPPVPTRSTTQAAPGLSRTRLTYDVRDESLESLLKWVASAVNDVPGLEVFSLSAKPEATQWNLRVVFQRYERIGS